MTIAHGEHGKVLTGASDPSTRKRGVALCLSGRGYTAMLSQAGCLGRLNDLGWLPRLACVSSVSGAAITAGILAFKWRTLAFDDNGVATNFREQIIDPLRELATESIEDASMIEAALSAWSLGDSMAKSPGEIMANALDRHLFGGASLQALPEREAGPVFIFTASNVDAGSPTSFSKSHVWNSRSGSISRCGLRLALAVAAASSSPPWLWTILAMNGSDMDVRSSTPGTNPDTSHHIVFTDGGLLDSLALAPIVDAYERVLISDAGYGPPRSRETDDSIWEDSISEVARIVDLSLEQLRLAERRRLLDTLASCSEPSDPAITYWDMTAEISGRQMPSALTTSAALRAIGPAEQEALINWGGTVCDIALGGSTRVHQKARVPQSTYSYDLRFGRNLERRVARSARARPTKSP